MFFSLTGKPEKAKEYLDQALKQPGAGSQAEILCAKGWLELQFAWKDNKGGQKPASEYFEAALKE